MKYLSVLFGCAVFSSSFAAQPAWLVMAWSTPVTVSVDSASIDGRAPRVTARVLWEYARAQRTQDGAKTPYKSMIGLMVFDCAAQRFGGAAGTSYSGDGGVGIPVAGYSIDPDDAMLSTPQPGSVGESLVAFVCTQAGRG